MLELLCPDRSRLLADHVLSIGRSCAYPVLAEEPAASRQHLTIEPVSGIEDTLSLTVKGLNGVLETRQSCLVGLVFRER